MTERKVLTLNKSVQVGNVHSAKGDAIFVERRKKVLMPGQQEIKEVAKKTTNAIDEKLRAVLDAARVREAERQKQLAEEEELRRKRENEISSEQSDYQAVREQLKAKEDAGELESAQSATTGRRPTPSGFAGHPSTGGESRGGRDYPVKPGNDLSNENNRKGKKKRGNNNDENSFKGRISVRDIIVGNNDEDDEYQVRGAKHHHSEAAMKRFRDKQHQAFNANAKVEREVVLGDSIVVKDLADQLGEKIGAVVKKLMGMGVIAAQNQSIDSDTAELLSVEFGAKVRRVSLRPHEDQLTLEPNAAKLSRKAPVVTIMGHVDHGKTSLLDSLRSTSVAAGEAGGITQHIAAYEVKSSSGKSITFLDTPGHETFSAMRARGAMMTDIVVLVVAANDSIMPQTIEAINHIKAAKVPMIVAINKIDLPDANPGKVKTDLLTHEVQVEDMGGEILVAEISATKKIGLEKLEELILTQAEMMDIKADTTMPARGRIVEAKVEKGFGSVATILMQQGTLSIGDAFASGKTYGRVRAIINSFGERVKSVAAGQPAVVLGFEELPLAGDDFIGMDTEQNARDVAEYRSNKEKDEASMVKKSTLEELFAKKEDGKKIILPIVIKADVQGSVEALKDMIKKIGTEKAEVNILSAGVGAISEGDVRLAVASGAVIIAFNVRADASVKEIVRANNVDIRYHSVVYHITDELRDILAGKLEPVRKENFVGYADVIALFTVGKGVKVAGCRLTEGYVKRDSFVRLLREGVVIYDGKLAELRREKNEVKEVSGAGIEFGMSFDHYNDLRVGDRVEAYEVELLKASL
ncbi:MAG: translation initiation factor IF-2 [Rickettsiales bacterium]|jgi:translation initiation factor IF-2|nr:translation initiation factor IF-2 [Rickettsiales bacterium]